MDEAAGLLFDKQVNLGANDRRDRAAAERRELTTAAAAVATYCC